MYRLGPTDLELDSGNCPIFPISEFLRTSPLYLVNFLRKQQLLVVDKRDPKSSMASRVNFSSWHQTDLELDLGLIYIFIDLNVKRALTPITNFGDIEAQNKTDRQTVHSK